MMMMMMMIVIIITSLCSFFFKKFVPYLFYSYQVLHHEETVIYHLVQLTPGRSYELRVSYASTVRYFSHFFIVLAPRYTLITFHEAGLLPYALTIIIVFKNDYKKG